MLWLRRVLVLSSWLIVLLACIGSCSKTSPSKPPPVPLPEIPKVNFSYTAVNNDDYPITLQFSDSSAEASEYLWDFGNGITSTEKNPSCNFMQSKTFKVKLRIKDAAGKLDSATKDVAVPYLDHSVIFLYLIPSDVPYEPTALPGMKDAGEKLRHWYSQQVDGKKFRLNDPVADTMQSEHGWRWFIINQGNGGNSTNFFWYNTRQYIIDRFRQQKRSVLNNLDFVDHNVVLEAFVPIESTGNGAAGYAYIPKQVLDPIAATSTLYNFEAATGLCGHELGHAFGLQHPNPNDTSAIMGTGWGNFPQCILLPDDKAVLRQSPFFQ